ncbi:MAG: zinc-binding protein, partial [Clostridia bacterium]
MEQIICAFCNEELTEESARSFNGTVMCEDCLDEQTVICDCCGARIWSENSEGNGDITLCGRCYDYNYTHCEQCGRLIHNDEACYEDDDDTPYCQDCYDRFSGTKTIESYNYKPDPIFYGAGNLFMGVELEIDKGGESHDNARELIDIGCDRIYCKRDGSIDYGFEIVSHPMSLSYHLNEMNWRDIL